MRTGLVKLTPLEPTRRTIMHTIPRRWFIATSVMSFATARILPTAAGETNPATTAMKRMLHPAVKWSPQCIRYRLLLLSAIVSLLVCSELKANEKLYEYALEQGLIQGIRSVELIRPDLLAVTVDPALSKCADEPGAAAAFQKPELFTISSSTDRNYQSATHPAEVGQESFERFNRVARGPFMWQILWWHCYYLKLPKPLASGHAYTIDVAGMDESLTDQVALHLRRAEDHQQGVQNQPGRLFIPVRKALCVLGMVGRRSRARGLTPHTSGSK